MDFICTETGFTIIYFVDVFPTDNFVFINLYPYPVATNQYPVFTNALQQRPSQTNTLGYIQTRAAECQKQVELISIAVYWNLCIKDAHFFHRQVLSR